MIVLLHSINYIALGNYHTAEGTDKFLIALSNLMSIGTIAFIFISELIQSNSYPDRLPKGFYSKRIKFVFLPFVFVSLFYAVISEVGSFPGITIEMVAELGSFTGIVVMFILNLFGNTHWFILVILQFYVLHHFFINYAKKYSMKYVLGISLLINVLYLSLFNFTNPPSESVLMQYIWIKGYWVPFFGWIFYFSLAYYCGLNYPMFIAKLNYHKKWLFMILPFTIVLVLVLNGIETVKFGSKRIDMIPFAVISIFILFYVANKLKTTPKIFRYISRYSLGIYLLHSFYLELIQKIFKNSSLYDVFGYFNILIYFIFSIACSMFTIYMLNSLPFGKYLVGYVPNEKIGISKKNSKHQSEAGIKG